MGILMKTLLILLSLLTFSFSIFADSVIMRKDEESLRRFYTQMGYTFFLYEQVHPEVLRKHFRDFGIRSCAKDKRAAVGISIKADIPGIFAVCLDLGDFTVEEGRNVCDVWNKKYFKISRNGKVLICSNKILEQT